MVSLWTLVVQVHNLAGPVLMLAYPLYASVSAIESPFKEDDTQWLTYWVLYSFFQLLELGFDRVLAWIPLWYTIKLVAIAWLVLPQFHGAAYVYNNFVKKYVGGEHSGLNEKLTTKQRQLIDRMSPSARASVSAFIDEYGSSAFDSVISAISKTNSKTKSPSSKSPSSKSPPAMSPSSPTRHRGSPIAAQPTKYRGGSSPSTPDSGDRKAQSTRYKGGSSPSSPDSGDRKADSFREYCRQPVKLLKASLHSLESRRRDIRGKLRTQFVA